MTTCRHDDARTHAGTHAVGQTSGGSEEGAESETRGSRLMRVGRGQPRSERMCGEGEILRESEIGVGVEVEVHKKVKGKGKGKGDERDERYERERKRKRKGGEACAHIEGYTVNKPRSGAIASSTSAEL